MGRAIYYCFQCSGRVTDTDLENGKAVKVGERMLCADCARKEGVFTKSKTGTTTRKRKNTTSTRLRAQQPLPAGEPPAQSKRRIGVLIGGVAGAAAILIAIIIVLLIRKSPDASTAGTPPEPPPGAAAPEEKPGPAPAPIPVPENPRQAGGKKALEKARAFAQANPEDLAGHLREFNEVAWNWDGTPAAGEARTALEEVKTRLREKIDGWMAEVEKQIKPWVDRADYSSALKRLDEVKKERELPGWKLAVEKRIRELGELEFKRTEELARKAEGAPKPAPDTPAPPPAPPTPVVKPRSEESKAYLIRWEEAIPRAGGRDYAAAIVELQKAAASLTADDVKAELAEDVEDLRKVEKVVADALEALRKLGCGSGISLEYRDFTGAVKKASGSVLQIDADRVEIRTGRQPVFVEWGDVTGSSLGTHPRGRKPDRASAILCLLEGDVDAAKALRIEVPAKYWTYGEIARSKIPKPEPAERSARELFYAAEREFRSMDTLPVAVEKYKTLRADFGSTALFKRRADHIVRRSEAGKEYYFAPADFQLNREGTIKLNKAGKLESVKNSDPNQAIENTAEFEFGALPGTTYRCWLQAGACCEETFSFLYQGTEVIDVHPTTKKKVACDPGSNFAAPARFWIRNLKKIHAQHAPKKEPKTAARWEWIEIKMPAFTAPGAKKFVFMTDQAGFSIGGAVVSSSRKAPPTEPEAKEMARIRELDLPPPMVVDPDLVAHWTLDEAAGEVVDLSGRGHTGVIKGGAEATSGRIGGAVKLKGDGGHVEVRDSEALRITGDITIAFWVRKDGESAEWVCMVGKGNEGERTFGVWEHPAADKRLLFQQYAGGTQVINMESLGTLEIGAWTHVTAVIEGSRGILYLNGKKDVEGPRTRPSDAGPGPLGIGMAIHHGFFNGAFDDVRIYRRALKPEEILNLVELGR